MIARLFIAILSATLLTSSAQAGVWESISSYFDNKSKVNDSMKILILHDKPGVVLEVKGKYQIFDPNTSELLSSRFTGKRKYIQPMRDGIKWGEEFPGVFQIMISPDDKGTTIVDGIEYKGHIYVYDIGGSISIVNEITFDEYVKTVLSSKLPQPLPEEALAALAIAVRTNAYYLQQNSRSNFWSVDAKQIGYHGYALSNPSSLIEQAVKLTHNMVMSESAHTFLTQWDIVETTLSTAQPVASKITLEQAAMFAHQGDHAAQILRKAFPNAQVDLVKD